MRAGVVLAGGRSTRFEGGDKAVADLAGVPMVRRVVDRLARAVDAVVVNCRAEQVDPIAEALAGAAPDPTFAVDADPDRGPVGGIATGLAAVDAPYTAVVACDMPFVDPAFVRALFGWADGHDAAVPRPDDWFQPTQAVYRTVSTRRACEAALARGDARVVEALADVDVRVVDREAIESVTTTATFENLNTDAAVAAAAERFR
jgi:molybdopterin-guanine dinucleotide biosynthesis protein A